MTSQSPRVLMALPVLTMDLSRQEEELVTLGRIVIRVACLMNAMNALAIATTIAQAVRFVVHQENASQTRCVKVVSGSGKKKTHSCS